MTQRMRRQGRAVALLFALGCGLVEGENSPVSGQTTVGSGFFTALESTTRATPKPGGVPQDLLTSAGVTSAGVSSTVVDFGALTTPGKTIDSRMVSSAEDIGVTSSASIDKIISSKKIEVQETTPSERNPFPELNNTSMNDGYPTDSPGYGGYGYNGGSSYGFGGTIQAPVCNPSLQNQNLFPTKLVVFQASNGESYSVGETLFILAKFPDTSCDIPDPARMRGCVPRLQVNVAEEGSAFIDILAAPSTADIESQYSVAFSEQPEMYTPQGTYLEPWVFPLHVSGGMKTADLDVISLVIPKLCNYTNTTFNHTKKTFPSGTLVPQGLSIDTLAPQIVAVYTTAKKGNYTAGSFLDIIVKFSKDVDFSELPDQYSDVYLNASAYNVQLFGVPYLELNSGAYVSLRGYSNPNDKSKLSFLYRIGSGEATPPGLQLDVAAGTSIQLNGGYIFGDQNSLDANLTSIPSYGTPGSMSDKTRPKVYITKSGEKFPPFKYDPTSTPDTATVATARRNGQLEFTRRTLRPTLVTVDFQLNSIFNLVEKSQQLSADFILVTSWIDSRFTNPSAPPMTLYPTSVVDSGLIWSPRLTFQNRRDLTNYIEGSLRVYNTGRVVLTQRFIAAYAVNLNLRDFPFDTQTFLFNVRSTTYSSAQVKFVPSSAAANANTSALFNNIVDPTFTYSAYTQTAYTLTSGVFTGYDLLSISITAKRIASMSAVFLIFPLCLVCSALCLVLHREPVQDARLTVPLTAISATMAFSFVISNLCPPVSYMTRIHLLILQTYIFSLGALAVNYYLWSIENGRKQLGKLNADNKALLADAHWMPRKIKPTSTNVVVLPEGIHKPPEDPKPAEPLYVPTPGPTAEASLSTSTVFIHPLDQPSTTTMVDPVKNGDASAAATAPAEQAAAAAEPPPPPEKSADTGAYPNKDGKYMDVLDLLDSDEVKTFKKMRWGGGPVPILRGLAQVSNADSAAWCKHVEFVDMIFRNLFPVILAISIGCIMGAPNLAGLGTAPTPYIGTPDS